MKPKKPKPAESFAVPEDRLIFRCQVGRRELAYDPLAVHRRLLTEAGEDFLADCELMATEPPPEMAELPDVQAARLKAMGSVLTAIRAAFDLPNFADGGLLDSECLYLFAQFGEFVAGLKKNTSTLPTSVKPTVEASSAGP